MPRTLPLPKGNEKLWLNILPEAKREPGRHVYMFRNTQTNQIVYTHYPKIEQRTLRQLPFIGKHSVPPRIRPDLWKAHCRIGPFPTAHQGRDALKKLRELRMLHEAHWRETNKEWGEEPKKRLIKNLMNQRANASADLAKVLTIQQEMGKEMAEKVRKRAKQQKEYLIQRWAQVKGLAESGRKGETKKLGEKIEGLEKLREEKIGDDKEARRLKDRITDARTKLRKITWAQRVVQNDKFVASVDKFLKNWNTSAKAPQESGDTSSGATEPLSSVDSIPEPVPEPIVARLLPYPLKPLPVPYDLHGIQCKWSDLLDAQYAKVWPVQIEHDTNLETHNVVVEEEYNNETEELKKEVETKAQQILERMEFNAENRRRVKAGLPELEFEPQVVVEAPVEEEPKPKSGIMKYMPNFIAKRMTASA